MSIEYTRIIVSLPCYTEIDGNANVVFSVNWLLNGTEGNFSASWNMTTQVPYVAGEPFVPYADLTQTEVNAWIDQYTDPTNVETAKVYIQNSIEQQKTVSIPPLPWQPPIPTT